MVLDPADERCYATILRWPDHGISLRVRPTITATPTAQAPALTASAIGGPGEAPHVVTSPVPRRSSTTAPAPRTALRHAPSPQSKSTYNPQSLTWTECCVDPLSPPGTMRYLVRRSKLVAMAAIGLVACGSPTPRQASSDSFCAAADQLFNKGSFASDGGGVVESLRTLDVDELSNTDRESMVTAIEAVEANINAFQNGAAPDGWSTGPAATEAARICQRDMQRFFVTP